MTDTKLRPMMTPFPDDEDGPAPGRSDPHTPTDADVEATAISHAAAVIAAILVVVAGAFAAFDLLQVSGLALFGALAASIASVAGRPSRGYRWVGPAIVGVAMLTVIVVGFVPR